MNANADISEENKPYNERLKCLNLTTLETVRLRGDLIEVFKILKVDASTFLTQSNAQTRGHLLKLFKPSCRLDGRKFSFSHRVVDAWNGLNEALIACDSINGFKVQLDKYMKSGVYLCLN